MRNPRSTGCDNENDTSSNSRKWNRKNRTSCHRPVAKESLQEKWERINPFQKSPQGPFGVQDRHEHSVLFQRTAGRSTFVSGISRVEGVLKNSAEQNTRWPLESYEPVEQSPSLGRPNLAQEKSDTVRKHHIQLVIRDLKSKVRRTTKAGDGAHAKSLESPEPVPFSKDLERFESLPKVTKVPVPAQEVPAECNESILHILGIQDSQSPPSAAISSDGQDVSPGNWIDKVTKTSRNKESEANATRKSRLPNQGRGRGGLLGIGKGTPNSSKFAAIFQGMTKERQNSPDSGTGRRARIQPGIKGLHGVLRKVRSYDSNGASKSSPRCRNSCRCCSEILSAHNELSFLEKSLWKSEVMLAALVERQARDRLEFSRQIAGLQNTCSILKRTQEMHYRNVLDEFNENHRVIGNVESHFGYVNSLIGRGRTGTTSDVMTEVLRLIGDNTITVLLNMVRATTSLYFYFFPRNRNRNTQE